MDLYITFTCKSFFFGTTLCHLILSIFLRGCSLIRLCFYCSVNFSRVLQRCCSISRRKVFSSSVAEKLLAPRGTVAACRVHRSGSAERRPILAPPDSHFFPAASDPIHSFLLKLRGVIPSLVSHPTPPSPHYAWKVSTKSGNCIGKA